MQKTGAQNIIFLPWPWELNLGPLRWQSSILTARPRPLSNKKTYDVGVMLFSTYQAVSANGQQAVNSITTFQSIVASLGNSVQQANAASQTIQALLASFQTYSVASMEVTANQSLATTTTLKSSVDGFKNVSIPSMYHASCSIIVI